MRIYFMSLFCISGTIKLRLEQIQMDFLWEGGALEWKPDMVKWVIICLDKRKGGLRARNLLSFNRALLHKWSWRYVEERRAFWQKVINGKYGDDDDGWRSREVRDGYGVGLWKAIRKNWNILSSRVAYLVGNRRRVRFWTDKWCGDELLRVSFPFLFALAHS